MNLMPNCVTDWSTPRWTVKIKRMTNGHLLTQRLLLIPLSSFREPGPDRDSYTLQHDQRQDEQVKGLTGHYFSNRQQVLENKSEWSETFIRTKKILEKLIHWTAKLQESIWDHTDRQKTFSTNFHKLLHYPLFSLMEDPILKISMMSSTSPTDSSRSSSTEDSQGGELKWVSTVFLFHNTFSNFRDFRICKSI